MISDMGPVIFCRKIPQSFTVNGFFFGKCHDFSSAKKKMQQNVKHCMLQAFKNLHFTATILVFTITEFGCNFYMGKS